MPDGITLGERARQLRNPTGSIGLAVADAIGRQNRHGNLRAVEALALQRDARMLELGCGTGDLAELVVEQSDGTQYTGLDSSLTIIDAANRQNAELIAQGLIAFHHATSEEMPSDRQTFTDAFSIGVAHFWPDPVGAPCEIHRVLRSGGLMLTGCQFD